MTGPRMVAAKPACRLASTCHWWKEFVTTANVHWHALCIGDIHRFYPLANASFLPIPLGGWVAVFKSHMIDWADKSSMWATDKEIDQLDDITSEAELPGSQSMYLTITLVADCGYFFSCSRPVSEIFAKTGKACIDLPSDELFKTHRAKIRNSMRLYLDVTRCFKSARIIVNAQFGPNKTDGWFNILPWSNRQAGDISYFISAKLNIDKSRLVLRCCHDDSEQLPRTVSRQCAHRMIEMTLEPDLDKPITVDLDEKNDDVIALTKRIAGMTTTGTCTDDLDWMKNIKSMTEVVTNEIEDTLGSIEPDIKLTNEDFLAWGRATCGEHDDRGWELMKHPLIDMIYIAFAACVAWDAGFEWFDRTMSSVCKDIEALMTQDTDWAVMTTDALVNFSGEMHEKRDILGETYKSGQQKMLKAILDGDIAEMTAIAIIRKFSLFGIEMDDDDDEDEYEWYEYDGDEVRRRRWHK